MRCYVVVVERNKLASKVKREIIKVRRQMALQQGERLLSDDELNATIDTVSDVEDEPAPTQKNTDDVIVENAKKAVDVIEEKQTPAAAKSAKRGRGMTSSTLNRKQPPAKSRNTPKARNTRRSLRLERTDNSDVIEIDANDEEAEAEDEVVASDKEEDGKSDEEEATPRRPVSRALARLNQKSRRNNTQVKVKNESAAERVSSPTPEREVVSPTGSDAKSTRKTRSERTLSDSPAPPAKRARHDSNASDVCKPEVDEENESKDDNTKTELQKEDGSATNTETSDVIENKTTTTTTTVEDEQTSESKKSDVTKKEEGKPVKGQSSRGTPSPRKKSKKETSTG